jgi:hypothetical protein
LLDFDGADLRVRRERRPPVVLIAVLLVIAVGVAVTLTVKLTARHRAEQPLLTDAWSERLLVGQPAQLDAQGQLWTAGAQPVGGSNVRNSVTPINTYSPQLYRSARVGVRSWTVHVPRPGRYAFDLLEYVDTSSEAGSFRVTVSSGDDSEVLSRSFTTLDNQQVEHLIGSVNLGESRATFNFSPLSGRTAVSGLSLTSFGAVEAPRTLFDQKFTSAQDVTTFSSVWTPLAGAHRDSGVETYITSPATEGINGQGDLYLKANAAQNGSFTSGEISSEGNLSFGYGEVSALLQLPSQNGMWPAFWAVGTNQKEGWPGCGEIDIMEVYNGNPDQISSHLHTKPVGGQSPSAYDVSVGNTVTLPEAPSQGFHWYRLIYQPGALSFAVDGVTRTVFAREDMESNFDWVFEGQRFFLLFDVAVLNDAAAGSGGSSQMLVKEVRITD